MHRHSDLGRRRAGHECGNSRGDPQRNLQRVRREGNHAWVQGTGVQRDRGIQVPECEQHHPAGRYDPQDGPLQGVHDRGRPQDGLREHDGGGDRRAGGDRR